MKSTLALVVSVAAGTSVQDYIKQGEETVAKYVEQGEKNVQQETDKAHDNVATLVADATNKTKEAVADATHKTEEAVADATHETEEAVTDATHKTEEVVANATHKTEEAVADAKNGTEAEATEPVEDGEVDEEARRLASFGWGDWFGGKHLATAHAGSPVCTTTSQNSYLGAWGKQTTTTVGTYNPYDISTWGNFLNAMPCMWAANAAGWKSFWGMFDGTKQWRCINQNTDQCRKLLITDDDCGSSFTTFRGPVLGAINAITDISMRQQAVMYCSSPILGGRFLRQ